MLVRCSINIKKSRNSRVFVLFQITSEFKVKENRRNKRVSTPTISKLINFYYGMTLIVNVKIHNYTQTESQLLGRSANN